MIFVYLLTDYPMNVVAITFMETKVWVEEIKPEKNVYTCIVKGEFQNPNYRML